MEKAVESYDPTSLVDSKYGELLANKLHAGEQCQCWFLGMQRASNTLLMIPIIGTALEFKKRFYMVVRTNQRIILIEFAKPFFSRKEKQTLSYDISKVMTVKSEEGVLLSSVKIETAEGDNYLFRDVAKKAASSFTSAF
ncbi:MAG: hypothetical protein GY847_25680 [Proteobacteria bacterium]|nr:hypothetical protein [Pseudomonadota bacterium]